MRWDPVSPLKLKQRLFGAQGPSPAGWVVSTCWLISTMAMATIMPLSGWRRNVIFCQVDWQQPLRNWRMLLVQLSPKNSWAMLACLILLGVGVAASVGVWVTRKVMLQRLSRHCFPHENMSVWYKQTVSVIVTHLFFTAPPFFKLLAPGFLQQQSPSVRKADTETAEARWDKVWTGVNWRPWAIQRMAFTSPKSSELVTGRYPVKWLVYLRF